MGGHEDVDWVTRGDGMDAHEAVKARKQWRSFLEAAAPYPAQPKTFKGRGIVMTGCAPVCQPLTGWQCLDHQHSQHRLQPHSKPLSPALLSFL